MPKLYTHTYQVSLCKVIVLHIKSIQNFWLDFLLCAVMFVCIAPEDTVPRFSVVMNCGYLFEIYGLPCSNYFGGVMFPTDFNMANIILSVCLGGKKSKQLETKRNGPLLIVQTTLLLSFLVHSTEYKKFICLISVIMVFAEME